MHNYPRAKTFCQVWAPVVAVVLSLGTAVAWGEGEKLIQGFENLSGVRTQGGKLADVQQGEGVTQGEHAASLPAKASVFSVVSGTDCRKFGWLKIDTLNPELQSAALTINFRGRGFNVRHRGYVKSGKDTLALPLAAADYLDDKGWPPHNLDLIIHNDSGSALVVDNLRLEPAAELPDGCKLIDLGPDRQPGWPGFESVTQTPLIVWSGEKRVHANQRQSAVFPDPITVDSVGPLIRNNYGDHFYLKTPDGRAGVGYFWYTHYVNGYTLPAEHSIKQGRRLVAGKRYSRSMLLSTRGLLMGKDGDWTPEWVDEEMASKFCDVVEVGLSSGNNRFDINNVQLCGVAVGPSKAKAALGKYVRMVQEDVSRYRRQFLVGEKKEPLCNLAPLEAEAKQGAMVFKVPQGGMSSKWEPAKEDRVEKFSASVHAGGTVVFRMAVVPLKQTASLSAMMLPMRSEEGRSLATERGTKVHFIERVARIESGTVEFHPWILRRSLSQIKARETVMMAAVIKISEHAATGKYSGSIRLSSLGGRAEIPVEINVYDLGTCEPEPVLLPEERMDVGRALYAAVWGLPDPLRERKNAEVTEQLLSEGFDSMIIGGPTFNHELKPQTRSYIDRIQDARRQDLEGPVFVDIEYAFRLLSHYQVAEKTARHSAAVGRLAEVTQDLARRGKLPGMLMYLGHCRGSDHLGTFSYRASLLAAKGGRPVMRLSEGLFSSMNDAQFEKVLQPFAAVVVTPTTRGDASVAVESFKKLGGQRHVYYSSPRAHAWRLGLVSASMGAKGSMVGSVWTDGMPYDGLDLNGGGLLVPEVGGSFALSTGMLQVWQGRSDFALMCRAQKLQEEGKDNPNQPRNLQQVLTRISRAAARANVNYDGNRLVFTSPDRDNVETLRAELLKACEATIKAKAPKR